MEKEMATRSSMLAWRIPCTEEPVGYTSWGRKELGTTEQLTFSLSNSPQRPLPSRFPPLALHSFLQIAL